MDLLVTAPELGLLADVVLSACSTDDVTPVICGGHLSVTEDGRIMVVATDRYRIATATIHAYRRNKTDGKLATTKLSPKALGESGVIVSRETWLWIKRFAGTFRRTLNGGVATLKIEEPPKTSTGFRDGLVTVRFSPDGLEAAGETSRYVEAAFLGIKGNFPPVWRLLDEARQAPIASFEGLNLRPDFMASIQAAAGKTTPVTLKPTPGKEVPASTAGAAPSVRPGPLYWRTRDGWLPSPIEGLIQPHLITA